MGNSVMQGLHFELQDIYRHLEGIVKQLSSAIFHCCHLLLNCFNIINSWRRGLIQKHKGKTNQLIRI